ncbi:HD domain-containing protein [Nonomuraea sp. NPDC049625]|uniref:HD domain-containing protein n=1 Tax=Nonomuraea sp. NPDC049625 TaxID=3155775 RepID=UPI0034426D24
MNDSLRPLLEAAGDTLNGERLRMVEQAHLTAAHWHRGQRRRSGEPYISHPVAVATILAELGMDHEVLCAALLHDVLEDTDCPEQELVREFGEPIVRLVRDMAALRDPRQVPVIWTSETGERVLMLKLADRLHNLRTLRRLPRRGAGGQHSRRWTFSRRSPAGSVWAASNKSSNGSPSPTSPAGKASGHPSPSSPRARSCFHANGGPAGWRSGWVNCRHSRAGGRGYGSPYRCSAGCRGWR